MCAHLSEWIKRTFCILNNWVSMLSTNRSKHSEMESQGINRNINEIKKENCAPFSENKRSSSELLTSCHKQNNGWPIFTSSFFVFSVKKWASKGSRKPTIYNKKERSKRRRRRRSEETSWSLHKSAAQQQQLQNETQKI